MFGKPVKENNQGYQDRQHQQVPVPPFAEQRNIFFRLGGHVSWLLATLQAVPLWAKPI